jgi:hypothetical protein
MQLTDRLSSSLTSLTILETRSFLGVNFWGDWPFRTISRSLARKWTRITSQLSLRLPSPMPHVFLVDLTALRFLVFFARFVARWGPTEDLTEAGRGVRGEVTS